MQNLRIIVILAAKWYVDKSLHKKKESQVNWDKLET